MAAPANIGATDVAAVQLGNVNILANLNDPNLDFARSKVITAIYTMTGNEAANDAHGQGQRVKSLALPSGHRNK